LYLLALFNLFSLTRLHRFDSDLALCHGNFALPVGANFSQKLRTAYARHNGRSFDDETGFFAELRYF